MSITIDDMNIVTKISPILLIMFDKHVSLMINYEILSNFKLMTNINYKVE